MPATVAHIQCRTARLPEPARDYTADFERWIGYRLHLRTRVNFFTRQVRLYRDSDFYWPVLDLTIPESEQPPDDAEVYNVTRAVLLIPPWIFDADIDDPSIIYFTPLKHRYPTRLGLT